MLGCLPKVFPRSTDVIIPQNNYSIVGIILQAEIAKGGVTMWIFRASIRTKDGHVIYARDRGKRAFKIWIGPEPRPGVVVH